MAIPDNQVSLGNLLLNSRNFNFLRQGGIQLIQQLASEIWTDYNLHDPGATFLETLCYALTEAGTQAGAVSASDTTEVSTKDIHSGDIYTEDVYTDKVYTYLTNLLTSGLPEVPQDFFTCAQVLPNAPVSLTDFQKVLLDHPLVKRAWVSVIDGPPYGNLSVLQQFNLQDNNISSLTENIDLNSNIFRTQVMVMGSPPYEFEIEIAFPYWDDPETEPFQNDVTISNLVFNPNSVNPWTPIPGTDSYFTFLNFQWDGNALLRPWPIVLRIDSSLTGVTSSTLDDILKAAANSLITPSPNPILLKQYNLQVMMAFEASHRIRSYLKNYRNLCENFSAYRSARIQEVAVSCTIEVGAGTAIESLLANIFYSIYQYISPGVTPQSLSDLQQSQLLTDAIFGGPLLKHGFIQDSTLSSNLRSNTLYISDVIRLIMEMGTGTDIQTREDEENRPVISVTNVSLSLYLDNRSITTGARDCLQLVNSLRYIPQLSLEKCSITVTRNNTVIAYNPTLLLDLYNEKINEAESTNVISPDSAADIPIPVGDSLPIGDYYSIQNDLPVTYGIGKAKLPASAPAERLGQAKQLQGYLFFFEQVLSGYFTQLAHVNALFSANATASTTLYQLPLYNIPAAPDLLLPLSGYTTWQDFTNDENNMYRKVLKTAPESEDQFLTRRHQMLDHLLGRLGEDMQAFSSLIYRQSYSDPTSSIYAASAALLQYKADYYYALPDLEKNRAQAYGHPAWRNKSLVAINAAPNDSFLWQILDGNGNVLFHQSELETNKTSAGETAEAAMVLATSSANYAIETDLNGLLRIVLGWTSSEPSIAVSDKAYATVTDAQNDFPNVQKNGLSLWLKYSLSSLEVRLQHLLGMAIKGERRNLVNSMGADEGFYIIEHLLLYPVSNGDATLIFPDAASSCLPVSESNVPYSLPKDPYSFILTVVFPSGYGRDFSDSSPISPVPLREEMQPDRFGDPEFRQYAEQTIRKFCPAHILPIVVWVDTALNGTPLADGANVPYPCFDNFESAYTAWLSAFFTDDVDEATIGPARNDLVKILNSIFLT